MYWNRFDIVAAHYFFCADFRSGQWSEKYAKLCRITKYFRPSPLWTDIHDVGENAVEIYNNLVAKEGLNGN